MTSFSELQTFQYRGIVDRRAVNGSLHGSRNSTMLALIGNPCGSYETDCKQPTNSRIADMMVTEDVGPFSATGLRPAIATLRLIFSDVLAAQPDLHASLTSAGMLCCRLVRGSQTAISNHSWGTAIDLKIDGKLDARGDGKAMSGLFDLFPFFNRHGFFWGAAFTTEDAMHFEASEELIREWAKAGMFGHKGIGQPLGWTIGDRGPQIERLQLALNSAQAPSKIDVDGIFGKDTRAAVAEFQRANGLPVTGIATQKVQILLGLNW